MIRFVSLLVYVLYDYGQFGGHLVVALTLSKSWDWSNFSEPHLYCSQLLLFWWLQSLLAWNVLKIGVTVEQNTGTLISPIITIMTVWAVMYRQLLVAFI